MINRVITISREFGSGGRTIGKKVAKKLGVPCYDARELGIEKCIEIVSLLYYDLRVKRVKNKFPLLI